MQNFSNEELERLKTYIDMQKAINTHREYSAQLSKLRVEIRAGALPSEVVKQFEQDLKALSEKQIQGEKDMAKNYRVQNPKQLLNQMQVIEHELYPRVIAHSPMRDTHEAIYDLRKQQRLQEWKQPARTPEEQAERTVQYAKEAMQAEQEYRRQHPASGGDGTPPGNQGDPNLVRERQLLNDEFERQLEKYYEKQSPSDMGLSQDEQNRTFVRRQEDARYGIDEAQKLNEQKLENLPYEARFRVQPHEKTPGRSDPEHKNERKGPEMGV